MEKAPFKGRVEGSSPHPSLEGQGEGRGAYSVLSSDVLEWYIFLGYPNLRYEEEKENELEELLVVPLMGSCPRCAMDVVPSGISSGTLEQMNVRTRHSECPFQKIRCTPYLPDRSTLK